MRLLITGAAGFVGSQVVRAALGRGHEVVAAVRSRARAAHLGGSSHLRLVEADLADTLAMRRLAVDSAPDLALHLAWSLGPDYDAPENLRCNWGSLALLQGLVDAGCPRIVFVGTHLELAPSERDMAEDDPVAPRSLYAVSKDAVRRVAQTYLARPDGPFVWVRLFNLYGPGQADWALVSYLIRRLLDGQRCPMTHGDQIRGFLHVRDAADALLEVGQSTACGVVHVGSDVAISVRDVAGRIARRLDHAELLDFGALAPSSRDAPRIVPSIARLRADVGFHPRIGIDEGLQDTIDWWRAQRATSTTRRPQREAPC